MSKIILTDVDDSVLQFSAPFQAWAETHRGLRAKAPLRDLYHVAQCFGIDSHYAWILVNQFIHDTEAMANLPPEPCAAEVLPVLRDRGYQFVAISACPGDQRTWERRRANLEAAFGFQWKEIHCVGLGGDKTGYLQAFDPTFWVEDHWSNAQIGANLGHRAILLDRQHSRYCWNPKIRRVHDWHGVLRQIESLDEGGGACVLW